MVDWAEWELNFFDVDKALDYIDQVKEHANQPAANAKRKPKRKFKSPLSVKVIRASAYRHIKVLDKMLTVCTGRDLSAFGQEKNDARTSTQGTIDPMSNPLRYCDSERRQVSVEDEHGCKHFFSTSDPPMPDESTLPPSLILHLDEGSSAFAMVWFLVFFSKLRMCFIRDIFHREWNDCRDTLSDVKLWWVIICTTMAFNLPHGPWESTKFWGTLTGSAIAYCSRASWTSLLFNALYESICSDQGIKDPSGSPDHRKLIFDNLLVNDSFTKKGAKVMLRRWFSWFDAFAEADKTWHTRVLAYITFGMSSGIYKDLTEVPLWKPADDDGAGGFAGGNDSDDDGDRADAQQAEADVVGVEAAVPAADAEKAPVKNQEDLKSLRTKCKKSVHVAACIMCRDQMQILCRIIYTVLSPIRLEHGLNAQKCRGPDAIRLWYISAAKCRAWAVLEDCCATLQKSGPLAYMGFTVDFGRGLPQGITVGHDMVQEEDDRAERAMSIWVTMGYHRTGSMMWHFASWLGLFALGASDDLEDVMLCIEKMRVHFRAFLNAKLKMAKNNFLKQVVAASPFSSCIVYEIADFIIGPDLLPNDWKLKRFRDFARSIFSSWGQTKIIEDNFKKMRDRESSDTRNKAHVPLTYWSMSKEMNAIGAHNREQLEPDDNLELGQTKGKLQKDLFYTTNHGLKLEHAEDIMLTAKWPTFSAQSARFQYSCSEFTASIDAKTTPELPDGVWDVSSRTWRGILFNTGMIVKVVGKEEYFVSFGFTGKLLVVLWRVQPFKIQRSTMKGFAVGTGDVINSYPTYASALDLDDYEAVPAKVISPLHLYLVNKKKVAACSGIVYLQTDEPMPIMCWAAKNCFWSVTQPALKTLAKELDVQPSGPDLVSLLTVLIHTILPEATEAEVNAILNIRCDVESDPLEHIDLDVIEALFPAADMKVVEDHCIFVVVMCQLQISFL